MNTTTLIAEVLVVGFLTLAWLALIFLGLHHMSLSSAQAILSKYEGWSVPISVMIVALSYQLGWLSIQLSYRPLKCRINDLRSEAFDDSSNYDSIKYSVQTESSPEVLHLLDKDRAVIRLSRSGIFNFAMLFIGLSIHNVFGLAILSLVLAMFCHSQTIHTYKSLYKKMDRQYKSIQEQPNQGD